MGDRYCIPVYIIKSTKISIFPSVLLICSYQLVFFLDFFEQQRRVITGNGRETQTWP